ncbi:DUF802 domain-containing protein [Allopusillimonas ginsengisoli]|uniref:DUF802 domain-containing protein n=1 Tax=Allopusillimonas ginsengisoli TaxID=453575 RepID=UPI00101FA180|nr:DUF802 domain-containing protein [Allopusillimonas ginsengisoli]TEA80171.1 DUF802 domain-containing protein [Allopusillimonas ginsengisoli]
MTRFLHFVVFALGLAVTCWIGASYVASNSLALSVTILVGIVYLVGALELYRYQRATASLVQALDAMPDAVVSLDEWLARLHPSLRNATRLRIEGERVGLPGPSLTPYLVGLLVLLGMLGTFLGMVATLRGTGLALEGATDLHTIQASLAAPVKGLGFAFGTSVAGVATSAMLGLLSALCRRERVRAAQMLDTRIATTLRPYSQAHQREESLKLMQRQADAMPAVVDRLQEMMQAMERHSQSLNERIEQHSLALSERMERHGLALNDRMERHTLALNERMAQQGLALSERTEQQSLALSERVERQNQALSEQMERYSQALNQAMQAQSQALSEQLVTGQGAFHANAEMVYARLADSVEQSLRDGIAEGARAASASIQPVVEGTMASLAREAGTLHDTIAQAVQQQMDGLSTHVERTVNAMAGVWDKALTGHQQANESLSRDLRMSLNGFTESFEQGATRLLDDVSTRLTGTADALSQAWGQALDEQAQSSNKLAGDNQQALIATVAAFEQHAASLVGTIDQSHHELRTALIEQDEQRLTAWTASLGAMADALRQELAQSNIHAASQQQAICDALAKTASAVSSETQAHASATIAEIERLVQAAAQAPRAAAEVVTEVRQKLSDSMARDNAMLEERSRLLETLGTLLNAVNHASTEQRAAVDALVATSADMLERVGKQFTHSVETVTGKLTDKVDAETARLTHVVETGTSKFTTMVEAETGKLAGSVEAETSRLSGIAAQVTGSAVEVASLGEAFGKAVQLFSESNASLVEHLQRLEATLDNSITRSDEQLAYYVAQARDVVDLSMMSQKQIMEELQQLASQRVSAGTEAV